MRAFSYKCRSDHRFYRKFFGTYGLSPLLAEGERGVVEHSLGVPTHSVANTCTAFFPAAIADQPRVVDGQVVPRKVMSMMVAIDHYLVDGFDGFRAVHYLSHLLQRPDRLGLGGPASERP
jgi:hypothetical protein